MQKTNGYMDNQQITQRDLVWLACFIDCEGSIQLTRTNGSKSPHAYHVRIAAAMTDARMVEEAQKIMRKIGVNPYIWEYQPSKGKRGNAKNAYHISLQRFSHVTTVLEAILPYLIIKDAQARLILDYIAHRTDHGQWDGRRKPVGVEEEQYWSRMATLNARGISETARAASRLRDEDTVQPQLKG